MPGASVARSLSSRTTNPSDCTIEDRMPAPSRGYLPGDGGATVARSRLARRYSRRPGLLAVGEAGLHREGQRRRHRRAGEAQDQRPRQDREGQRRGDRIAGQPDQRHAAHLAERDRPSRLDRQPPEIEPAELLDRGLDMVLLAGRDAAGGHDQIVPGGCRGERIGQRGGAVRADAEIADGAAEARAAAPPA